MAYERGSRSVEVELSRVQSWVEGADIDLYGRNGDKGVIREHRDNQAYLTLVCHPVDPFFSRLAGKAGLGWPSRALTLRIGFPFQCGFPRCGARISLELSPRQSIS